MVKATKINLKKEITQPIKVKDQNLWNLAGKRKRKTREKAKIKRREKAQDSSKNKRNAGESNEERNLSEEKLPQNRSKEKFTSFAKRGDQQEEVFAQGYKTWLQGEFQNQRRSDSGRTKTAKKEKL